MKISTILAIIIIVILFNVIVFSFLSNNTGITGKVIDGNTQATHKQLESQEQTEQQETYSSSQPEEDSQTDNQQTNDNEEAQEEPNQEEKCDGGYSDEYKCDGKVIRRKWINSDCSFDWLYSESCDYSCENGNCAEVVPCTDSDNGKDYYTKGQIILNEKNTQEDYCESNQIVEYYCTSSWYGITDYVCPYGCSDGKCNPEPQEQSNYFKVTRVIDGDTIEIEGGDRVRLICIDTPETYEDYYSEAKDYLTDLILNEEVELVKDKSETDRYGRLLRYIYLDGDFVNEMIVEVGWARAYPYSPDTTLCPVIQSAESEAKSKKIGIWQDSEDGEDVDTGDIICSYNAYNCPDFSTHSEAQAVYLACGGLSNDIHRLDGDNDGSACETLP